MNVVIFFFFQAEDGIRDYKVTGVQTCALPICSIVGSGTVSNKGVESGKGKNRRMEWPKGYSCIAEKRCIETIQDGAPKTEFMRFGDTIRIEMKGKDGQSIFGAIDQNIVEPAE